MIEEFFLTYPLYYIIADGRADQNKKNLTEDILCIADPALGLKLYTKKHFCKNWFEKKETENKPTGLALLLELTEKFKSFREK